MAEETALHTRILRLALAVGDSRAYWANVDPSVPPAQRILQAFEQRWFGAKSLERVRTLLPSMAARYDAFPPALEVLRRWRDMDAHTQRVVCHWHLQLSDPLYRRFTGDFLPRRREQPPGTVDPEVMLHWLREEEAGRWAMATLKMFASKLLTAAGEAGLVSRARAGVRTLQTPVVPDIALVYVLRLLEGLSHHGTLLDNAYLASVGLAGPVLETRLRSLPGLTFRRMGELYELHWSGPDLFPETREAAP